MSVFKHPRRGTWVAKFKLQGRQYKKEGFQTRSGAEDWVTSRRAELTSPPIPETIPITFSQVSTRYLDDCKARFQKNTWRQKAFVYRELITFLNGDPIAEMIPRTTVTDFLMGRRDRDGNTAANRDLKELKALFNWAIRNELLLRNPCLNLQDYPEEPKTKYVPPAEDINKVILAADPEDTDLIQTVYHTAGRISEILKLTWEDVNFDQRWIRLWTRKRRGGELQEDKLILTETLHDILKHRWDHRDKTTSYVFHNPDGSRFTYHQKKDTMRDLCKKAKVKRFGFHAIRHHVASILSDSGKASLGQIQKMLRHKRTTTTDLYIKSLDAQLRQVAEVLDEQNRLTEERQTLQPTNQTG